MRVALVLLVAMVAPALSGPAPGTAAPADVSITWYLTGERGALPGHGLDGVLLMSPELAGTESSATFSSVAIPDLPGFPADQTVESVTWYWDGVWDLDMEVRQDVIVTLYVQASVQASADVRLELRVVDPSGATVTVAQAQESVVVGNAEPEARTFTLPARGEVLPEGSTLALTVRLDGASLATVILYDADETPSRITLTQAPLDSDADGVPDSTERRIGTDPSNPLDPGDGAYDTDGDGLPDWRERALGTDPIDPDTDGDGWSDGAEITAGTDPLDADSFPVDTDGDGLADSWEMTHFGHLEQGPGDDPDGDGCDNFCEFIRGSDPNEPDTDGDGITDGEEVARHTDPTVARRTPGAPGPQLIEIVVAGVFLAAGLVLSFVGLGRRHRL